MTSRISLGLERIALLLKRLGDPHRAYEIIHVAGTNGKGSVSAMIANTLTRAGFKTGLYTSPHLAHKWDCIKIDNESIRHSQFLDSEGRVKDGSAQINSLIKTRGKSELEVSSFEQMTATAFEYFKESKVDVAVVEVGLGGKNDATNVVQPVVSVITAIGIDHTDFLGKTIQGITRAKGGIIKPGVPVVVSSDQEHGEVYGVLGHIQREVNPGRKIRWTPPNSTLDFRISNRNTAREAIQCYREEIRFRHPEKASRLSDAAIEEGLLTTKWRGRCEIVNLEVLGGGNETLIDGAHNQQSVEALRAVLNERPKRTKTFILSMTAGKDASALTRLLSPGDTVFAVEFEKVDGMDWINPMSSSELCSTLQRQGHKVSCFDCGKDVARAIASAHRKLPENDLIICGSLYLVGQIYRLLEAAEHEQSYFPALPRETTLPKYDTAALESKVQQYWEGLPPINPAATKPIGSKLKFLLPPPNVTGSLHIGHALTLAIQDAYCRHYRMNGQDVVWMPGTDHAGIATQSVVAKQLAKKGISAKDLPRDDFINHIWQWKQQYGEIIGAQMRRLGTCLDWTSEYFTMDETRKAAVLEAFRKLWEMGLIKREQRMVNWSVGLQSVISDIEVDRKELDGPTLIDGVEFGKMWRIRYEVVNDSATSNSVYLEVDTTRPETVFGDRVLAVHPDDQRYQKFIGMQVKHPLLENVFLRVVADKFVKPDIGTGCVKITPAHDSDDYTMSLRHADVPVIPVYDQHGKFLPGIDSSLSGMDRLQARAPVLQRLAECNALVSWQPHKTSLDVCSRSDSIIEPALMPQWYITVAPLTDRVLAKNDIKMSDGVRKEWERWLEHAQDWCISRQLVWGHRVPLYRVVGTCQEEDRWVFGVDEADAQENADGSKVEQDTDVLDTWFSSSLLPLSAFGWPKAQLDTGHQLEFIESGPDILFFWLIRMAMMCTFLNDTSPFKEIVLHPLIRDAQGRKMSKSLGNVIDPLNLINGETLPAMIETLRAGNLEKSELQRAINGTSMTYPQGIKSFGADALRFALIQSTVQKEALKFDIRSVEAARYLCTKLWNAINFFKFSVSKLDTAIDNLEQQQDTRILAERWILRHLAITQENYDDGFTQRSLAKSSEAVRSFLVDQVCDVFLEFVKVTLRQADQVHAVRRRQLELLRSILERILQMLAPFMPHITEELWHALGHRGSIHRTTTLPTIAVTTPDGNQIDIRMHTLVELLTSLRNIKDRKTAHVVLHVVKDTQSQKDVCLYRQHLAELAGIKNLDVSNDARDTEAGEVRISGDISYTVLSSDVASQPVIAPPAAKQMEKKLMQLREMTAKQEYVDRVPAAVQEKHRREMQDLQHKLGTII